MSSPMICRFFQIKDRVEISAFLENSTAGGETILINFVEKF
jgi:hypothetical protein